jgi:hypothetical protein
MWPVHDTQSCTGMILSRPEAISRTQAFACGSISLLCTFNASETIRSLQNANLGISLVQAFARGDVSDFGML